MKKPTTFDSEVTANWQEAFRLDYHWGNRVPSIIAATSALGTLNHLTPSGCYLAKQKLEVQNSPLLGQKLILQGDITKKLTSLICRSDVVYLGKNIISLMSVLIYPQAKSVINNLKPSGSSCFYDECQYWRTFTRDEVNAFASLSGDTNKIHTGENPVVQGMLILLALEDYLASKNRFFGNVDVHYLKPVRIENPVKLYEEEKTLYGIVGDSVCFQLNFKEEK
ncbi:MAG TPA: MaoC family dehydratase [Desulfobacteria bacterium]|nr:MaoC family dehydratase [Desulfobacteria bacterium]